MPGPFGCLAFSGPLNWHFDWVDAGQKVIPVATGNTSDRLGRKKKMVYHRQRTSRDLGAWESVST